MKHPLGEVIMRVLNFYAVGKTIPPGVVYIGCANPGLGLPGSRWANPLPISKTQTRTMVFEKYATWLDEPLQSAAATPQDLLALSECDVVCFCAPKGCRNDILETKVEWARSLPPPPSIPHVSRFNRSSRS